MSFRRLSCVALVALVQVSVCVSARGGDAVVSWPSLKKLDDLAEKCEAWCDQKDVADLRGIAPAVKAAAVTVAGEAVPAHARRPDDVKVLQGDLKSLSDSIANPATQNGDELTAILAGVHPIVEKLMESSGMPHVHENEAPAAKPAKAVKP